MRGGIYMAEKVTSMRLNEEDLEQFKVFAKDNGLNQQQAFNSLIALAELEKAKDTLGDRAKSIDTFRDTINRAIGMYVNVLEENTTAEQTIREELQKELSTKDNTISTMYEQLQELKADKINSDNNLKEIESKSKELQEQLQKANSDNAEKSKSIDKLNSNNDLLQEQLQEYKQYKEQYKELEEQLEQLKADNSTKYNTINDLINSNKQLKDKLSNNADMLTFYKDNISKLESEMEGYKADMKSLEGTHKQEVAEVKAEHQKALEGQQVALQEQYISKMDVEVSKKDLEIERLQNQIEQLKADKAKQQHKPKATKSENI